MRPQATRCGFLTAYPTRDLGQAPLVYWRGSWTPECFVTMPGAKHFTTAELSAEFWRAACNRRPRVYDRTRDIPGETWEWEHGIVERFLLTEHTTFEE